MQRLTARALSIARPGPDRGRIASTVAVSPVSWGISEAAAWGPQLEPNRVLTEMATLGANGIEAGPPGFLPDRSETARAASRIQQLHVNDLDGALAQSVRDGGLDYAAAVSRGLFKPLGSGDADASRVVEELRGSGYRGCYGLQSDIRLESVEDDPLAG